MKHDRALRDDARTIYDLHHIDPDADYDRAERRREPAWLEALDEAVRRREQKWEWEAQARQLPLL